MQNEQNESFLRILYYYMIEIEGKTDLARKKLLTNRNKANNCKMC